MLPKNLFSRISASLSTANIALPNIVPSSNTAKINLNCQIASSASTSVLQDTFGRQHTYLRVSLTEKCNLRCKNIFVKQFFIHILGFFIVTTGTYCMPEEGVKLTQNDKLLQGHEIVKLISFFVTYGINKVRFTGGEPLVRKDCLEIIREVGRIKGLEKIAITTNGITLAKKVKDLKLAGLNQLNISLDTLEPKKFEFIAKRNGWSKVMNSIDASIQEGFSPVKVIFRRLCLNSSKRKLFSYFGRLIVW